jgi:hypothetical protein
MPEAAIYYSDIPQLSDDFWQSAMCSPFYRPTKLTATVSVDFDVLL